MAILAMHDHFKEMGSLMMSRNVHPFHDVDMVAQLSDLKEVDYKNTLLLSTLIELLVEKGIVTRKEIVQKANELEIDLTLDLLPKSTSSSINRN